MFPPDTSCFILGMPNYGCEGKVNEGVVLYNRREFKIMILDYVSLYGLSLGNEGEDIYIIGV